MSEIISIFIDIDGKTYCKTEDVQCIYDEKKQEIDKLKKENEELRELVVYAYDHFVEKEYDELLEINEQMEARLNEAEEVIKWYADDSIDHHNYHAMMGHVLTIKAKNYLAKGEK